MRIVKRCYLLFLFSLALLLMCGQLPELFTLIDDTSNEFVEESLTPVFKSIERAPTHTVSQRSAVFEKESTRIPAVTPSKERVLFFSPDLLRLLTIQRK